MRHSRLSRAPNGDVRTETFTLKGGINLVDSPLDIPASMLLASLNFECGTRSGYLRTQGHERYDGQAKPSAASYWILAYDGGDGITPVVDGICTGLTSGASGKVLALVNDTGTFPGSDADGYVVLTQVSGDFQDNESLTFTGANNGFDHGFSSGFG